MDGALPATKQQMILSWTMTMIQTPSAAGHVGAAIHASAHPTCKPAPVQTCEVSDRFRYLNIGRQAAPKIPPYTCQGGH